MGNFELLFACVMRDGAERPYERIIAVPDLATAQRVASAMVGERVNTDQTLDRVVRVISTEHSASVARTPNGYHAMWQRVFKALDIDIRLVRLWYGADIGLGTNPTGHVTAHVAQHGEPEIVGFFPWPRPKDPMTDAVREARWHATPYCESAMCDLCFSTKNVKIGKVRVVLADGQPWPAMDRLWSVCDTCHRMGSGIVCDVSLGGTLVYLLIRVIDGNIVQSFVFVPFMTRDDIC